MLMPVIDISLFTCHVDPAHSAIVQVGTGLTYPTFVQLTYLLYGVCLEQETHPKSSASEEGLHVSGASIIHKPATGTKTAAGEHLWPM